MFETVEDLNKKLPRPEMTGHPEQDFLAHSVYISNARALRSEAFACIARSIIKAARNIWRQPANVQHHPHGHRA